VNAAAELQALVARLYPLCRSITGDGVRHTLDAIAEFVPLERHEVASGTPVLDWEVPREWQVRAAHVTGPDGVRLVDFADHNLHLVSYSAPFRGRLTAEQLAPHLHSLPEHPDWIPYRTSYYEANWGFCVRDRDLARFRAAGHYEVVVDTTLAPGHLSYGEFVIPGATEREVVFFTHVCHPSLANDNLSGIAVSALLARSLRADRRRHTYRFVWAPGTIGSITWLARNRHRVGCIAHGLTLSCLGDAGHFRYKATESGTAAIDRMMGHLVRRHGGEVLDFEPYGYDERQFNSPGFRLPFGRLTRTPNGRFAEYHTSADDLGFVSGERLAASLELCRALVDGLEGNRTCRNLAPFGEPQLGRRGLYRSVGGVHTTERQLAMLWILNQADGTRDLLAIAERAALPLTTVVAVAGELRAAELLADLD
jgi:aminopeptidase-like protein